MMEVTGYPINRIVIDELGAAEPKQVQRAVEYIPYFRELGIKTIFWWLWKENWCASPTLGLWKQDQPCAGRVSFTAFNADYSSISVPVGGNQQALDWCFFHQAEALVRLKQK